MKRLALLLAFATLLPLALAGVVASAETTTFTGEYFWAGRDSTGDLEAMFTPNGEGRWDVAFHFAFRDSAHVYSGTAEGSLSDGELKGTVHNESKKRTFVFRGAFENGVFRGEHAETTGGGEQSTGTLTLGG